MEYRYATSISIAVVILVSVLGAFAQDEPETPKAVWGVKYLHEHSREPDSFQLVDVYLLFNKKADKPPKICIEYKGKNGFGGYSSGQAVMEPDKKGSYSYPFDPNELYGELMFEKVYCPLKKNRVLDITDQVKKNLTGYVSR